jgi:O-methyltransferase
MATENGSFYNDKFSRVMGFANSVILSYPLIPNNMVRIEHVRVVLENIGRVLIDNVPGDIVEFGCFEGTTSLFIRRFLDACGSNRRFHVYDAFQGLPDKGVEDGDSPNFYKGCCQTNRSMLEKNFNDSGLALPEVHEGWFRDIREEDLPKAIAFAFLDGDFYTSITDSLNIVYSRMATGSRVVIHDYNNPELPGVTKACTDFLAGRKETATDVGCGLVVKL